VHKRQGFASATVCLFVFDIMVLNGASRQLAVLPFRRLAVLHDVASVTAPQASA
jgi:ATP-dependent DNA ligase